MRKLMVPAFLIFIAASCNNPADKTAGKSDSTTAAKPAYAYTIDKPDNWDMNSSTKNTEVVMNALKAFENKKVDESIGYFADSVIWRADDLDGKFSKDSLKAMFNGYWNNVASLKVDMHDFESVVSKDKKDEYVTLWYHQTLTDKKGKTDSMAVINDFKMMNGKIVSLEESMRHLKAKK